MFRSETGVIAFDLEQTGNGRGVYVCPDEKCLSRAHKTDVLSKALKKKVPEDVYLALARHLAPAPDRETPEKLLGFALRARSAVLGSTAVEQGLKRGKVRLVILDSSASESTRDRMVKLCTALSKPLREWQREKSISEITGKANCRLAGITDAAMAHVLSRQLKSNSN